jgi:Uma2 family endonuclease
LLERRRKLGLDKLDEVWEGVYHMNPGPHGRHANMQQQLAELLAAPARAAGLHPRVGNLNLGETDNYRVPDGALFRDDANELYYATAALVIEIVSPGDESWDKLGFYAAHRVDELLIVDPRERAVHWLGLGPGGEYRPVECSSVIELTAAELDRRLDWPK